MNTQFCYFYRDACNYKVFKDVIIEGQVELKDLMSYLRDETFFIPSEIGLEDLQDDPFTTDDHIWHEMDSILPTMEPANCGINAQALIEDFQKVGSKGWNEYFVFEEKGLV